MWNYRLIKYRDRKTRAAYYAIHEVYYNGRGKPYAYTAEPVVTGETSGAILRALSMMLSDVLRRPVIDKRKLDKVCGRNSMGNGK